MKGLHSIAFILLIIGGLNWLFVGLNWGGIGSWIGEGSLVKIIYVLVGLAAVYELLTHKKLCKQCDKGGSAPMTS